MGSSKRGYKSICVPFASEAEYQQCLADDEQFRGHLQLAWALHPELFPAGMAAGFKFHGFVKSKKRPGFKLRRIRLKDERQSAYQIRPSFMLPYLMGTVAEVEKALYLLKWEVPFGALTYVFGRNDMFWYRAYLALGRNSLVGTTVKDPAQLPAHLVADEKHTWLSGQKVYVASTAAQGCILGASLAPSAGTEDLTRAYGEFQAEAQQLNPTYEPVTVNTDGWTATQQAWKTLFPKIVIILCFLHAWLKIRDRCQTIKALYGTVKEKVWHVYEAQTVSQFSQRIRRLREWTMEHVPVAVVQEPLLKLCGKAPAFKLAYAYPGAYRTSNALDRLMNYQDRVLYGMQYFHGSHQSAWLYLRSMALIWNFHPYGKRTRCQNPDRHSPFKDLNGFCYVENWLENLLIAASMAGQHG